MLTAHRKVALVTGGASGLGRAIGKRLASDGAIVIISDVQREVGRNVSADDGFTFFEQDVTDEARWNWIVREIEERHGYLDVVVNSAGSLGPMDAASPENTRFEDWRKIFNVNVDGVFLGCRAAIPVMRRSGGGSIVNISSVAGLLSTPYATAYGASKAAVRQLTKSVAQYCAEQRLNIRCNSIHPGTVRTPLMEKVFEQQVSARGVTLETIIEEAKERIPLREFTTPEQVAAAVAYLTSDAARCITGERLILDGGFVNCDTHRRVRSSMTLSTCQNQP